MFDGDVLVHTLDGGDMTFRKLREAGKTRLRVFVRDPEGDMRIENARLVWNRFPGMMHGIRSGEYSIIGTPDQELLAMRNETRRLDELNKGDRIFPLKPVTAALTQDGYPDQDGYSLRFQEPGLFYQLAGGFLAKSE